MLVIDVTSDCQFLGINKYGNVITIPIIPVMVDVLQNIYKS